MSWNRREVLATLGVASAQAILSACGAPAKSVRRSTTNLNPDIRLWLRDAVAMLKGAGFQSAHALAVSRYRTTAALDVLGAGVARSRCDGVVLTVRERDGSLREQVTNDLSRDGVMAAVRLLAIDKAKLATVDFGRPLIAQPPRVDPQSLSDGQLLARVAGLAERDRGLSSRVVYAAALLDIDDAHVFSVAPGHDFEQRLVRIRRSITRVAWNGSRPVVSEVTRSWAGGIDDQDLSDEEIVGAKEAALAMMTPRTFADGEHSFVLEPAVAASVIDVAVRGLLTSTAMRRPEVARRLAIGANAAAANVTLVDDPTVTNAYGGFRFDDEGERANPLELIQRGQIVGHLGDRAAVTAKLATTAGRARRPGHVGRSVAEPSHLRLAAGTTELEGLLDQGFVLEGALGATIDPSSDRVVIAVSRAREWTGGKRTGRMYADIELVGELSQVLGSISALSKQTQSIGIRDEVDGQPRWRSVETPWVRGRAVLRARRRPA